MAKHVLTKLDKKTVLEEAARTNQVYPLKASWRKFTKFAAVLCCLLIITIPLGIWMWIMANKAHVAIGEEGFALKLFGTRTWAYKDIESFSAAGLGGHAMGGGLVGVALASAVSARSEGLRGPLMIKLKDRKIPNQIPAHQIQRSVAMARELEKRTGLEIFPPEAEAKVEAATATA